MTDNSISPERKSGLAKVQFFTGLSMCFERIWPLLLPVLIVVSTFLVLSWFGLFRSVPDITRALFIGILGLLALVSFWGLRKFRVPTKAEIYARLESVNDLAHQPIASQSDTISGQSDEFSSALWQIHQHRMAEKLNIVTAAHPRPKTYELDTWALRTLPALLLFIAFTFSTGSLGGRISDAWYGMAALPAIPPRVDAWVTPPTYTGKAPIFLSATQPAAEPILVPENSVLTVRIGAETQQIYQLSVNGSVQIAQASEAAPSIEAGQLFTTKLTDNSSVTLGLESGAIAQWAFEIVPDTPPAIAFSADPSRAKNGTLTLSYIVTDDYGATKGGAEFRHVRQSEKTRPLYEMPELSLSLPRRTSKDGTAKTAKDLTLHPLAGEEFEITLNAQDGARQSSQSSVKMVILPEYYLANPLARAIAEDRRLLARDANAKPTVLQLLDALTIRPDETIKNASHFLGIETARIRLHQAKTDDELRSVVEYLWEIALTIDKNSLSDAERQLKQAQDKLAEAIENGASDQEIEQLTQELRQAMNEFLKEFAEQQRKNPSTANNDQNSKELKPSELDKMLDKLEELAKQGAKEQAKELLNQLRDMMDNLQAQRGKKGGKGGEGQSQMEGKLNELGKLLREQQKLLDETFQKDRDTQTGEDQPQEDGAGDQGTGKQGEGEQGQGSEGENGTGGQPGGKQDGMGGGLGGLQQRQNKLGGQLQGLMDGLKGLGIEPGTELEDAGKAMGRAGKNLGNGQTGAAIGDEKEALNALRKGAEGVMNQMKQAMGDEGGGQQPGDKGPSEKDPLGRARADDGSDTGKSTKVPDEIDVQRAREILDAIRKRLGNALSPELEKQYLERLLNFD